jgi:uncharacterized protein
MFFMVLFIVWIARRRARASGFSGSSVLPWILASQIGSMQRRGGSFSGYSSRGGGGGGGFSGFGGGGGFSGGGASGRW